MVENFVAENHQESVQCIHDGTLKGHETISYELPLITKEGALVEVLLSSSSQRNSRGEIRVYRFWPERYGTEKEP
ncbi:MAG TPA: hypothetical protein EYO51_06140 [Methylococcaceae bacterium]|nr:hypothetical protein [Methylococcaceae bacterium]